ncbi:MAG: DNA recombination protein RmuC [Rhizobiales bacterium]|nr:DNA recombination protein RmuC [Hyphomicrobiales bacterium]
MSDIVFQIGTRPVTVTELLLALAGLGIAGLLLIAIMLARSARIRREVSDMATHRARELEGRIAELMQAHSEMNGKLQTVAEISVSRQSDLTRTMNERLDKVSHRLGQNLQQQTQTTGESLSKLHERLVLIDEAQKNITGLASQVVGLKDILANKQTRGAFGQGRMEAIVADNLPKGSFSFQATLSNKTRPDCIVHMPNGEPGVVIDAKFPLEAYEAFRAAHNAQEIKAASARMRTDISKHIADISGKYLISGETQDTAIMFVPSESVYAELYDSFDDLIQKAYRARVVIVSPSMLMLAVQVMQAIFKDTRMREQAHLIQGEVVRLMDDVHRLRDRVLNLQRHFGQTQKDLEQVLVSSDKISNRGRKIEQLEFEEEAGEAKAKEKIESSSTAAQPDLLAGE